MEGWTYNDHLWRSKHGHGRWRVSFKVAEVDGTPRYVGFTVTSDEDPPRELTGAVIDELRGSLRRLKDADRADNRALLKERSKDERLDIKQRAEAARSADLYKGSRLGRPRTYDLETVARIVRKAEIEGKPRVPELVDKLGVSSAYAPKLIKAAKDAGLLAKGED